MNHDMSRYALENGPDEPRYVYCWNCGGTGDMRVRDEVATSCPICVGSGELPYYDEVFE